jgi:hypothetical protein
MPAMWAERMDPMKRILAELKAVLVPGFYGKLEIAVKDGRATMVSVLRTTQL